MSNPPAWKCLLLALPIILACSCGQRDTRHTPKTGLSRGRGRKAVFVDISKTSGVGEFLHTDGSSGRRYYPEQFGGGCMIFDYDNDGWPDIFLANGAALPGYTGPEPHCALYHNNHDGTFTDTTLKAGVSCHGHYCIGAVAGDYDNDGYLDIYVTCLGSNLLLHNNGNGAFTDVTARARLNDPGFSTSACWFDYDHDGYLDLYVAHYAKYDIKHDRSCGRAGGHKSYCGPNIYPSERDSLFHNNGDGTFTDISERAGIHSKVYNGMGVISLDYDGDGRPDLFVADDQTPNILWHNNGDGTFTDSALQQGLAYGEKGTAQAGMGVDVGDTRNNNTPDILMSDFTQEPDSLFRRDNGSYHDVSIPVGLGAPTLTTLGFGDGFLDYDNDGWLDIFVANGHVMDDIGEYSDVVTWAEPNQLFHNRGNGTFQEVSASVIGSKRQVSRGVAFGDLFNTGRTDILINTLRGHPILLRNDYAPESHWLTLRLHAAWGNPQAVGATVTLRAAGVTQRRYVHTGGSYASSSDMRPHFGLGKATTVDVLQVHWPSGRLTTLHHLKVDRILDVSEKS